MAPGKTAVEQPEELRESQVAGQGSDARGVKAGLTALALPEELLARVLHTLCKTLLEVLRVALVSREWRAATMRVLIRAGCGDTPLEDAFRGCSPVQFLRWPAACICVPPERPDDGIEYPEDRHVHYCTACRTPIVRAKDILSSEYYGGKGPAFLVDQVYNATHGHRIVRAHFTTGAYLVQDFACRVCGTMLGKKYVGAENPVNMFKVGRYLLEQTLVYLPTCCGEVKGALRADGQCARCDDLQRCRTASLCRAMTGDLAPAPTRILLKCLSTEADMRSNLYPMPTSMSDGLLLKAVGTRVALLAASVTGGARPCADAGSVVAFASGIGQALQPPTRAAALLGPTAQCVRLDPSDVRAFIDALASHGPPSAGEDYPDAGWTSEERRAWREQAQYIMRGLTATSNLSPSKRRTLEMRLGLRPVSCGIFDSLRSLCSSVNFTRRPRR
jgi:hypothetical protein